MGQCTVVLSTPPQASTNGNVFNNGAIFHVLHMTPGNMLPVLCLRCLYCMQNDNRSQSSHGMSSFQSTGNQHVVKVGSSINDEEQIPVVEVARLPVTSSFKVVLGENSPVG